MAECRPRVLWRLVSRISGGKLVPELCKGAIDSLETKVLFDNRKPHRSIGEKGVELRFPLIDFFPLLPPLRDVAGDDCITTRLALFISQECDISRCPKLGSVFSNLLALVGYMALLDAKGNKEISLHTTSSGGAKIGEVSANFCECWSILCATFRINQSRLRWVGPPGCLQSLGEDKPAGEVRREQPTVFPKQRTARHASHAAPRASAVLFPMCKEQIPLPREQRIDRPWQPSLKIMRCGKVLRRQL